MIATAKAKSRSFNDTLPEVVFVPGGDNREAQRIIRLAKRHQLRQLYRGVYSSNLRADDADVVARNWSAIVSYLAPGAVLSFRSAFDAKPREGAVYITRIAGAREFELPGLVVRALVRENRGPILDAEHQGARDTAYSGIYIASTARAYLENLTRDQRLSSRQLPQSELEAILEKTLSIRGPQALNALRDAAREAAGRLAMESEFARLDKLIGAMLGTRPTKALTTARARARAEGRPYDAERVELFETVAAQLRNFPFADVPEPARSGRPRDLFAFVESYFSNYIEGTTFTIEEAEQIVFEGKIIPKRDEDSHDVLGTFEAAQRDPFYSATPRDENEFIDWLRNSHRLVMGGRPDVAPGEWKLRANQAGNTLFVLPELVDATLRKAWPLFGTLEQPMAKALFAMFVVSEVHPFADGNGRISRLIMNAFLSNAQQCRIIVPTLYRDNYLSALKQATHQKDAEAYIRSMRLCQAWTSELRYDVDIAAMEKQLVDSHAVETDTRMHRLLSARDGEPMGVPEERSDRPARPVKTAAGS